MKDNREGSDVSKKRINNDRLNNFCHVMFDAGKNGIFMGAADMFRNSYI